MTWQDHDREAGDVFTRSRWMVAAFALGLLLLSAANLVYRYTLPTDGWSVSTTDITPANWVYEVNLVGAESALEAGDELLAVEGRSVRGTATSEYVDPPPAGKQGNT
ncbi:MAG: hypothetical protein R2844_05560 [Caldilineales bacterium]